MYNVSIHSNFTQLNLLQIFGRDHIAKTTIVREFFVRYRRIYNLNKILKIGIPSPNSEVMMLLLLE